MKIRTASKIFIAVARYKGFETNRQPYTPQQQHRAVNRLIPLPLRKFVGICNKVKDPKKRKNAMGEIVVNSKNHKLYIIEKVEDGKCKGRELTEEDIAKLSNAEQQLVRSYQLQAQAMQELAMEAEKAAAMCDKLDKMSREWAHEQKQWIMQGWGYKPKLNPAAKTAFRIPQYWFRIRSFCVRSPYG